MLIINTHITLCAGTYSKPLHNLINLVFIPLYELNIYYFHFLDREGGTERDREIRSFANVTQLANDKARF